MQDRSTITARIEALYRAHNTTTRRHLRRLDDVADDALSTTWAILTRKLLEDADSFDDATAAGWLTVTAKHEAYRLRMKAVSSPDDLDTLEVERDTRLGHRDGQTQDAHGSLLDYVAQRDANRRLAELLRDPSISLNRRRALAARMVGLSYTDMCERFGWTYTAANRYVNETRKLARERCSIDPTEAELEAIQ